MLPLSGENLLEFWEKGRRRHPVDRSLLALGYAVPGESFDRLADWSVGRRDVALIRLRCASFGPRLSSYLDCPRCGERLEFALEGDQLLQGLEQDGEGRVEREVEVSGLRFRLPSSRDLAEVAGETDPDKAARRVARLCLLEAGRAPEEWPEGLLLELDEKFSVCDPGGNLELDFRCEGCAHEWNEPFDIGGFFWEEIEASAKRLLNEIHFLARAYGWTESEILSLSGERRAVYMKLVNT